MDNLISYLIREKARATTFTESRYSSRLSTEDDEPNAPFQIDKISEILSSTNGRKYFLTKINQNTTRTKTVPIRRPKWDDLRKTASIVVQGL